MKSSKKTLEVSGISGGKINKQADNHILPMVSHDNIYKKEVIKIVSSYVKRMKRHRNPVHVAYQVNYYTKKMLDEMGYYGSIISIDWGKKEFDGECILHLKRHGAPSTAEIEIRVFSPEEKDFGDRAFVFFLHEFTHSIFLVEREMADHPTEKEIWFHSLKMFIQEGYENLVSPIVFMDALYECLSEYDYVDAKRRGGKK